MELKVSNFDETHFSIFPIMKILLISLGTRGDMEPFLAIADLLKAAGHETVCLFPEQFRELAEEGGHRFKTLGPEFLDLLEGPIGKRAMGGSGTTWQKIISYARLAKIYVPMRRVLAERQAACLQAEAPDRIVHHTKAVTAFLWGMEHPGKATLVSPVPYIMHPTDHHSHIAFNADWGRRLNRASYGLGTYGLVYSIKSDTRKIAGQVERQLEVGGRDQTRPKGKAIRDYLKTLPTIYTISPALFSRPEYWAKHIHILGYQERDKTLNWTPPAELESFLARHPRVLFFTFGSMVNPDPVGKTREVLKALETAGIPALLNTAGGGLVEPDTYNAERYYFVKGIPYDWILPRIYGMVHHGGSGTTHLGVKYGCASMIVPHIIDQYMWNRLLADRGVGPKGPGITRVTVWRLAPLLKDLWENPTYKLRAEQLAAEMAKEDFGAAILRQILQG
jgi:sterol 3beta-glucosyltransferase